VSPDDPRHGSNAGYVRRCRCNPCRAAHSAENRYRRLHPSPLVPAVGTHRRIQALHRLGWSAAEISRRAGRSQFWAQQVLLQEKVQQRTADTISRIYDALSMTWNTQAWAPRTAAEARSKGWPPPLAWDDEDLDNPAATPYTDQTPVDVDEAVVDRVLSGEWRLPTTRQEKVEVTRRWHHSGRSLADLCRLTGWKEGRYFKISHQDGEAA
jgi:hypothetical protein